MEANWGKRRETERREAEHGKGRVTGKGRKIGKEHRQEKEKKTGKFKGDRERDKTERREKRQ